MDFMHIDHQSYDTTNDTEIISNAYWKSTKNSDIYNNYDNHEVLTYSLLICTKSIPVNCPYL